MKQFIVACDSKETRVEALNAKSACRKAERPPRGWRWVFVGLGDRQASIHYTTPSGAVVFDAKRRLLGVAAISYYG